MRMRQWLGCALIAVVAVGMLATLYGLPRFLEIPESTEQPTLVADAACADARSVDSLEPAGEVYPYRGYRLDDKVCYRGEWLRGADPTTFEELAHGFSRDKHHVYWRGVPVVDADARTFSVYPQDETSWDFFAHDAVHVFMTNSDIDGPGRIRILVEADPATFELLDGENMSTAYQRDHNHIFYLGQVMAGADANSFRLLPLGGSFDAQDAAHRYWQGAARR